MNLPAFEPYLLHVICYSGACWLIYRLLLRDLALHAWNRRFLLIAALLPVFLPLGNLSFLFKEVPAVQAIWLPALYISHSLVRGRMPSLYLLPRYAYLFIAVACMMRWLIQYLKMSALLRRLPAAVQEGFHLVKGAGIGPGTFGCTIFFPGEDADPAILRHEQAHIRLGHRFDLAAAGLLQCAFWPNIFLHLLVRELRMVHEFQADAAAVENDSGSYVQQLLRHIFGVAAFPLAHTFFHQPVKRRIMMLQQTRRPSRLIAPLALGLVLFFSAAALWAQTGQKVKAQQHPAQTSAADAGQIFEYVQQMPEFKGDVSAYISGNIKYPPEAVKEDKQGRVIIKFVVNDRGVVEHAEVAKSSSEPLLDKEALRVVSAMPPWTPGMKDGKPVSVYYYLPIVFRL